MAMQGYEFGQPLLVRHKVRKLLNQQRLKVKHHLNRMDNNKEEIPPECSICLDNYEPPMNISQKLECHHCFHKQCIAEHIKYKRYENLDIKCPLCRKLVSAIYIQRIAPEDLAPDLENDNNYRTMAVFIFSIFRIHRDYFSFLETTFYKPFYKRFIRNM